MLAAPLWTVIPSMSEGAIMPAFVVVTIGGLGSFAGAVIAGLMVGVVTALTIQFEPDGGERRDVRVHGGGAAAAPARPAGRAVGAVRVMTAAILRHPILWVFIVLVALTLLWQAIGAPVSLITQIAIYTLYGAGVNLLVGYTGLVPFGASVFFGCASYAVAISMRGFLRQRDRGAGLRRAVLAGAGRRHRADHPAPARPVFLPADAGVFADRLRDRLQMDRR